MSGDAKTVLKASKGTFRRPPPVLRSSGPYLAALRQPFASRASVAQPNLLQPSLRVGAANDPLEREAETTAERIVSMPAPEPAAPSADPAPGGQGSAGQGSATPGDAGQAQARRASADDQPDLDTLETAPPIPADHQDPEVPKEEDVDTAGLSAEDMAEIESGEPEDSGGEGGAEAPPPAEEPPAQAARSGDAAVVGAEGGAAPADVAQRVAQPGSGRPLPAPVRDFMEPRFGKDFSDVRIHDAPQDRTAARRIGARAFTHRQHIWMGPGEAVEDRRLLAHELTHVVQQTKRSPVPSVKRAVAPSEEAGEPEVRRGFFANKAEGYAREVPGYRLVTFILGKSPITDERVDRNATNLLGALLGMIPGGNRLFERLKESRVIEDAYTWVSGRLGSLKITWARIKGLIGELLDYLPALPSNAIAKAKSLFAPLVRDIVTFVGEVKDKILEFIIRGALKLAGPLAEKVWGVIKKAGAVISTILEDPLAFAKNLFKAVLQGFKQFGSNVLKHIKSGLLGWLFGTIQGLEITIPEKLDFKGLISIALQVVGLTYDNFRARLVKKLGPRGERMVSFLEKSVEVVKILVKEGFAGLWQRVLQMIEGFKETVIGGIRDFVIKTLIMGGLSWLAGLSNPVGAVVKVVLAIYNIIKTFLERLNQILEVANSIFSSIGAIAAGNVKQAADFIEKTIAATIPVVISFLAALVPVSGIVSSIRNIIKKLRKPVDKAIDKMIGFVVKKAKKLFSKIIGKLNKKRKLPSAKFKVGKKQHQIYAVKSGRSVEIHIASPKGHTAEEVKSATLVEKQKANTPESKKAIGNVADAVDRANNEIENKKKNLNMASTSKNNNAPITELGKGVTEGGQTIDESSAGVEAIPQLDPETDQLPLLRYVAIRSNVEGEVDSYYNLSKMIEAEPKLESGVPAGKTYELDHVPARERLEQIQDWLRDTSDPNDTSEKPAKLFAARRGRRPKNPPGPETKPFGLLQQLSTEKGRQNGYPAIALYAPYHAGKSKDTTLEGKIARVIDDQTKSPATKIDDLKELLVKPDGHIDDSIKAIKDAYKDEPIAAIKSKVDHALVRLKQKAIFDLQLVHGSTPPAMPAAATSGGGGPREQFNFGDATFEGHIGTYSTLRAKKYTKRGFLESDHIVDDALPDNFKNWKIHNVLGKSDPTLTAVSGIADEEQQEAAIAKRDELRKERIFSKPEMTGYTTESADAVVIFAGVHAAVGKPNHKDLATEIRDDFMANKKDDAVDFVIGEGSVSLDDLTGHVEKFARDKFIERFDEHERIVKREYAKQPDYVASINLPNQQDAAREQMNTIIEKVEGSLVQLRSNTEALFNV